MSVRLASATLALIVLCGCGHDFMSPPAPTTGRVPAPLGQIVDVTAELPNLQIAGAYARGATLELELSFPAAGRGSIDGRFEQGRAVYPGGSSSIEAIDAAVTLLFDGAAWRVGGIGPLRIGDTTFSLTLDGASDDDGFRIAGVAEESQTALGGSFEGWRRERFLVAMSDFFGSSGTLAEISLVRGEEIVVRDALESVSSDCVLAVADGAVWAINRLGFDNVQRLDPAADFRTAFQSSLGPGANPHGLAAVDGALFVSRYEPPFDDLAMLDADEGTSLGTIELAGFADNPDGTPRADRVAVVDGLVVVALQDIDRTFTDYAEGKLVVVDPAGPTTIGTIPLGGKNPGSLVALPDGTLRVALSGIYPGLLPQELSGGVVDVDPRALSLLRTVLDDDVAGGNLGALATDGPTGWVVVTDAAFVNRVVAFDPAAGSVLRTVTEGTSLIPDLALAGGGTLAIPDRDLASPGLCLWRTGEGAEVALGCAPLGLSPFSLVALD